jgi:hypothetical protein
MNGGVFVKQFEVGKSYYPQDRGYDPVEVIKRTDKSIRVRRWYDGSAWWMRIKKDSEGNEMCTDSTAPKNWRFVFTYCADDPV